MSAEFTPLTQFGDVGGLEQNNVNPELIGINQNLMSTIGTLAGYTAVVFQVSWPDALGAGDVGFSRRATQSPQVRIPMSSLGDNEYGVHLNLRGVLRVAMLEEIPDVENREARCRKEFAWTLDRAIGRSLREISRPLSMRTIGYIKFLTITNRLAKETPTRHSR